MSGTDSNDPPHFGAALGEHVGWVESASAGVSAATTSVALEMAMTDLPQVRSTANRTRRVLVAMAPATAERIVAHLQQALAELRASH